MLFPARPRPPRRRLRLVPTALSLGAAALGLAAALAAPHPAEARAERAASGHDFAFPGIDGAPLALSDYAGQPLLVVNTASRCGFTHQYDALQTIWERYRDAGLVVIGAPSNDFRQELKDAAAVKQFCEVHFGIDFPMTDIVGVTGGDAHPFFAWAAAQQGAPSWNFHKYLVDADGRLVARFPSRVGPDSDEMRRAIESVLPSR